MPHSARPTVPAEATLALYKASKKPMPVEIPAMRYLMIDGEGDPNRSTLFQEAVQTLFNLAYTIKFGRKKRGEESGYRVAPLEGIWWSNDPEGFAGSNPDKSKWKWTLMISQPDYVIQRDLKQATKELALKKDLPLLNRVSLKKWKEGPCVQVMHVGPYAEEKATIERLHEYAFANGMQLRGKHHEIYLGDPRRSKPERLKTIVRQPVQRLATHTNGIRQ